MHNYKPKKYDTYARPYNSFISAITIAVKMLIAIYKVCSFTVNRSDENSILKV